MVDSYLAVGSGQRKRLKDMGDGTHAEVMTLAVEPTGQTVIYGASTLGTGGFLTPPNVSFDPVGAKATATLAMYSATVAAPGTGHVPADTLPLAGGTQTTQAVATIATTKAVSATINAAGTGGTTGAAVVTGTTGTGTKFQADVVIAGGAIVSVTDIKVAGSYSVNPTDITQEPVTGGGLTGAKLAIVMGVNTVTVGTAGVYSAVPANPVAQGTSSGSGVGATLNVLWGLGPVTITQGGFYGVGQTPAVALDGAGVGASIALTMQVIAQRGGTPVDWTNGGGTLTGATTSIPLNNSREYFKAQNCDTTAMSVTVTTKKASDGTATTTVIPLAVASAAGKGDGGVLEFKRDSYIPLGAIVVTGTSGKQAVVLEG